MELRKATVLLAFRKMGTGGDCCFAKRNERQRSLGYGKRQVVSGVRFGGLRIGGWAVICWEVDRVIGNR
jgi:hypothetical protein